MQKEQDPRTKLAFGPRNFQIMLAGIVVLLLGFVIMSLETAEFGFGVLGLTVGPVVLVIGFVIQFFAIFHQDKSAK